MRILNSSKVPQIIKTGIKGIQNQATLVTVQTLMPTLNLKKTNKQTNQNSTGTTTDAPTLGRPSHFLAIRYSMSFIFLRNHEETLKPSSVPFKQRLVS